MAPLKFAPIQNIGFRYSEDQGENWFSPASGDQRIVAISGLTTISPKTMLVDTRPCIVVNQNTGHVFITYAARSGADDGDIFVVKSTDAGGTWSTPVRVNQDQTTRDQWNPWMGWDELTGALVIAFYDSRDFPSDNGVHTYVAVSYPPNQGEAGTWTDLRVSDASWNGNPPGGDGGDYIGVATANGVAYPVWSDDRNQPAGEYRAYVSPVHLWGVRAVTEPNRPRLRPRTPRCRHRTPGAKLPRPALGRRSSSRCRPISRSTCSSAKHPEQRRR